MHDIHHIQYYRIYNFYIAKHDISNIKITNTWISMIKKRTALNMSTDQIINKK